jgi:hypothetical protein
MKTQLCQLHEHTFMWPLEEDVLPEKLSPLPKNIAKNFIETFYKEKRVALVEQEKLWVKEQVRDPSFISCRSYALDLNPLLNVAATESGAIHKGSGLWLPALGLCCSCPRRFLVWHSIDPTLTPGTAEENNACDEVPKEGEV